MTFLESIFARLERVADEPVLGEVRDGQIVSVTGADLLAMIAEARGFAVARGLKPGDRCALLAPNSIRWVALDLALMSEGVIVVPLDPRQTARDWKAVISDSTPSLICSSDSALGAEIQAGAPPIVFFDEIFGVAQGPLIT
jgi:acyl-CoA synthetase (AMP-forming)/AMP-acid ligase II